VLLFGIIFIYFFILFILFVLVELCIVITKVNKLSCNTVFVDYVTAQLTRVKVEMCFLQRDACVSRM